MFNNEFNELDEIAYKLFCEEYIGVYGNYNSALTLNHFIICKSNSYYKEAEKYLRREKILKIKNHGKYN